MEQPKFKFGEKVVAESGEVFVVTNILHSLSKRFFYLPKATSTPEKPDYDGGYWEEELKLFEEPQKKKLYAYKSLQGLVGFSLSDIHGPQINGYGTQRTPEFDLDFSLGYACSEKPL